MSPRARLSSSLYASTRTVVVIPARSLAETILAYAAPVLEALGPEPSIDLARAELALAIELWNALQLASARWGRRKPRALAELRKVHRGRQASPAARARFDAMTARWQAFDIDPRLVETWAYQPDAHGRPTLTCTPALPEGVEAEVPPPIERRVAVAGQFLDQVRVPLAPGTSLVCGVEQHQATVAEDGGATIRAKMPVALQLFATGHLPPVGGPPVAVAIGGRELGPLVLTAVRCGGADHTYDVAVLEFRPPPAPR